MLMTSSTEAICPVVSEGVRLYLSALLAGQPGSNIQDRVSHGILRSEHCTRVISDRLIHVLLLHVDFRAGEAAAS